MQAYHFVHGGRRGMAQIMRQGRLLPAEYHIVPESMVRICDDDAGMRNLAWDGAVMRAVLQVVGREAEAVAKLQAREGIVPAKHKTNLTCLDFMALDHKCVFLSLGDWTPWARRAGKKLRPNGFAFDAAKLLGGGAELRKRDLIFEYTLAVTQENELYRNSHEPYMVSDALRRLSAAFRVIHGIYTLSGSDAVQWMESAEEADLRSSEMTVCGPMDISSAVEVWVEGKRVQ